MGNHHVGSTPTTGIGVMTNSRRCRRRWSGQFHHHARRFTFSIGRVTEAEAKVKADEVDYQPMRLGQGLIDPAHVADIANFIRHDGTIPSSGGEAGRDKPTLASLGDRYPETHGNGRLEAHLLRGINRHLKHLVRKLADGFPIRDLSFADLQGFLPTPVPKIPAMN